MRYKAILYFNDEKISEGTFDVGIMEFDRKCGTTYTERGFKIEYKAMKTKQNKEEEEGFLKKYPTPESFYGE